VNLPRLVVAAPHSGAGKTTLSLVLAAAFLDRGLRVQPYKVGPDYLDPTHLSRLTGRTARNLDSHFLEAPELLEVFRRGALGAGLALVEGVMGLFDGKDALGQVSSTAQVAKLLRAPVVLCVDASAMAGSVAALVRGFRDHDPGLWLAGVVVNRVGSARHAALLEEALRPLGVPFLGYLPREPALALPERHLGLWSAAEAEPNRSALLQAAQHLRLEDLLSIAQSAPPLPSLPHRLPSPQKPPRVRLGIAQDKAFSFYYPENLELIAGFGAELVPFSPLADPSLPEGLGGVYLGGGYPELYAEALSANQGMRLALRRFKGPIYAECGGLMYLGQALQTDEGLFPMVGLIPGVSRMTPRLALGYRTVEALKDSPLAQRGWQARGHEFHFSERPAIPPAAWRVLESGALEGYAKGRLLASYIHLYFPSEPRLAERLVAQAAQHGEE